MKGKSVKAGIATGLVMFAVSPGLALAVAPKTGDWRADHGTSQGAADTFKVTAGEPQKIRDFRHNGFGCIYELDRAIRIKENGRFRYNGGASLTSTGGTAIIVVITGEFVSNRRAIYTADPVTDDCCSLHPEQTARPV